jgi:hypothetical protein
MRADNHSSARSCGCRSAMFAVLSLLLVVAGCLVVHRAMLIREEGFFAFLIRWDGIDFMWSKLVYLSDCLRLGLWPLWNPYEFAGTPVFCNVQTLYHNPIVVFYAAIVGFTLETLQLYLVMLYVLGACSMYGLARHFGAPQLFAVLCGILYSASGFALGNAEHVPQLHLYLTEPLTLLLLLRYTRAWSPRSFVLAVLGVCLLIGGGYPSIMGHLMLFNFLFLTVPMVRARHWRGLIGLISIHALAVAVMSPMLVPAALSLPWITRGEGVTYAEYVGSSLPPLYFASLGNPFLGLMHIPGTSLDVTLKNCAVGLPVAMLLVYAVARPAGRGFLLTYAAVSIMGCLGGLLPTARLFHLIPVLGNSYYVTYEFRVLLIVTSFLLAVSSCSSFFAEPNRRLVSLCVFLPILAASLAILPFMQTLDLSSIRISAASFLRVPLTERAAKAVVLALPGFLTVGYLACLRRRSLVVFIVLGLIEVILSSSLNYFTVASRTAPEDRGKYVALEQNRDRGFPIAQPFVRNWAFMTRETMPSILKVHSDWGYDGTRLQSVERILRSPEAPVLHGPYLRMLPAGSASADSLQTVEHRVTDYGPNRVKLRFAMTDRPAMAVLNFMYYPGWEAIAQGLERKCIPVLGGLTGVVLETGDDELLLEFRPAYYKMLCMFSLSIILVLSALACLNRASSRSNGAVSPTTRGSS